MKARYADRFYREPEGVTGPDAPTDEMAKYDGGGVKFDQDKAPWHLMPSDALEQVVLVLQMGEKKYGSRNWEAGMDWDRPFSALMRHAWAWWQGEDRDRESGLLHTAHMASCCLFLISYERRQNGHGHEAALALAAVNL